MSNQIPFWEYMAKADKSQEILNEIPTAQMHPIAMEGFENPKKLMAVAVDGDIVATVSKQYKLVQHKTAFHPIFRGLHNVGSDYEFSLFMTDTKAFLNCYVDEIPENGQGIKLGFRAVNSIDGRTAIKYSMMSQLVEREKKKIIRSRTVVDVWGYRQVCSNGMKVRVPLEQHEELYLTYEKREKIEELLHMAENIAHVGDPEAKIEAVQYAVEAMALLKDPVAALIKKAKELNIDGEKEARGLIAQYIGKRMRDAIIRQYNEEGDKTLWGLYNAVTFVASHGVSVRTMNGLIDKSADMLMLAAEKTGDKNVGLQLPTK